MADNYREPGVRSKIGAFFVKILPKVGPLKALKFHLPTPQTDALFETSFNGTIERYRHLLAHQGAGQLHPDDRDFDTGNLTSPCEYSLAEISRSRTPLRESLGTGHEPWQPWTNFAPRSWLDRRRE